MTSDNQIEKIRTAVILGAGNVAWHLSNALYGNGIEILQVYNRTPEKGKDLADSTGARFIASLTDIDREADIYILAVSDDATVAVASSLGFLNSGILVHTSGSLPMQVLTGFAGDYGVLYPLQTFTRGRKVDFQNVPFLIEASGENVYNKLSGLISSLNGQVYAMNSDDRQIMHCAAVISSNFTNHLLLLSEKLVNEFGLPQGLLKPLITETIVKAYEAGPFAAQTGPAQRGNLKIIEKHLALLKPWPEVQKIYRIMSESIIQQYSDKGG